jgi:hypothetical protein
VPTFNGRPTVEATVRDGSCDVVNRLKVMYNCVVFASLASNRIRSGAVRGLLVAVVVGLVPLLGVLGARAAAYPPGTPPYFTRRRGFRG